MDLYERLACFERPDKRKFFRRIQRLRFTHAHELEETRRQVDAIHRGIRTSSSRPVRRFVSSSKKDFTSSLHACDVFAWIRSETIQRCFDEKDALRVGRKEGDELKPVYESTRERELHISNDAWKDARIVFQREEERFQSFPTLVTC